MPFAEHILLENVCQWLHIEKLKTTFHFLKKKKKRKSVIKTFRVCYSGNTFFNWEVLKYKTEAMLTSKR